MRLADLKVGTKLISGFILVASISLIIGVLGITNMSKINDATDKMYAKDLLGLSSIKEANTQLMRVGKLWREALIAATPEERKKHLDSAKASMASIRDELEVARPLYLKESSQKTLKKLDQALTAWEGSMETIFEVLPNEPIRAYSTNLEKVLPSLVVNMRTADDLMTELSNIKETDSKEASLAATTLYEFSKNTMITMIIVGLVVGLALGYGISLLITRPLRAAVDIARKLSVGDASGKIIVAGTDELNELLASMDVMKESIKESYKLADANARVKEALSATSSNVMIADVDRNIIYMNKAVERMLRGVESELRKALPHFSVDKIIGSNMDIFHKNPAHQSALLSSLRDTYTGNIVVAGLSFRLIASPIFSDSGERLGTVVEWIDRTQEVAAEAEVSAVVNAAGLGNFKARIPVAGKSGFFLNLAEGLNTLMQTSDTGLGEVNRVLGAIAKGDLTEKITTEYSGTFGELKNYCNDTTASLSDIIGEIRTASETIFTASSEIASGNADLSSRTEQQAANLEETASSMEELTSTVKLNADNAKQANVLASQASTVAIDGGELIQQVVVTMSSINESSQKIADIIGVIDGIAFQTNILALNAAVEAARAGDQGRGFAVVASEVRTLAQRSANAAKDIKGLISDSVKKIENGNTLVGKSGDTMKEIVTAIKRVNDIMAEIAAASTEQSAGIEEVSTAVSQMDEMTQQNAALVEEAAAAAESLQSQADQLTQRVAQFRLGDDDGRGRPSASMARISAPAKKTSSSPSKKLSPPKNQDDEWESF